MPKETIASVKRQYRIETGALRAQLREAREEQKAAIDRAIRAHVDDIKRLTDANELLAKLGEERTGRHLAVLATKDQRIDELFRSNNEYQAEARAARAETARLQAALSDASRVIAALGQRAEG